MAAGTGGHGDAQRDRAARNLITVNTLTVLPMELAPSAADAAGVDVDRIRVLRDPRTAGKGAIGSAASQSSERRHWQSRMT